MRTQRAVQPVCCDSVLFQEHDSAHGMCIAPHCIEPFVLQYFSAMKYNNSLSCFVLSIICCCLITVLYIKKYIYIYCIIVYIYGNVFAWFFMNVFYNTKI